MITTPLKWLFSHHVHKYGEWQYDGADHRTTPAMYKCGLRVMRYRVCACGCELLYVGRE